MARYPQVVRTPWAGDLLCPRGLGLQIPLRRKVRLDTFNIPRSVHKIRFLQPGTKELNGRFRTKSCCLRLVCYKVCPYFVSHKTGPRPIEAFSSSKMYSQSIRQKADVADACKQTWSISPVRVMACDYRTALISLRYVCTLSFFTGTYLTA